jgi:hypothetical protein
MSLLEKASIITTPTAYGVGVLNSIKPAIPFGEELVVNGNFATDSDWNLGSGWSIGDGKAVYTGTTNSDLAQSSILTSGKTYKLEYEVVSSTLVNGIVKLSGSTASAQNILSQTTGTHTLNFIANGTEPTSFNIRVVINSSGQFEIDNVSVKEVTDADFDFTRNSSATRVNPDYLIQDVSILSSNLVQNGNFSELGSELVTNGNFATDSDWNLSSESIISNGKLIVTNAAQNSSIGTQSNVVPVQKPCKLQFDIVVNSGSFRILLGSGGTSTQISASGTYTFYETSGNFGSIFLQARAGGFDGSIDNVSVKQVDPNDNWIVTDSDANNFVEITQGQARLKFLNTSPITSLETSFVMTAGKKYKLTVDVLTVTSGGIKVDGAGISETFNVAGITTRIINPTGTTPIRFYRATADVDVTLNSVSLIEIQQTDIPRLDYTNGTASILLEGQSTNLITYSEDFGAGSFTSNSILYTANTTETISPSGNNTADKFEVTTSNSDAHRRFTQTTAIQSFTLSVYIKGNKGQKFQLFLARDSYAQIKDINVTLSGNWQRIVLSDSFNTTSSSVVIGYEFGFTSNDSVAGQVYYLWGAQLEALSYPTSYIPTLTGSTVTRAAETLNNAGNSDLINSTEGVLYAEIKALSDDSTYREISISDGSNNNRIELRFSNFTNRVQALLRLSGGNVLVLTVNNVNITSFNKFAFKYKQDDFALWVNGVETVTLSSGNVFTSNTLTELAFDGGSGEFFYGKCKTVAVFKEALSDTELACLTSTNNREIFLNYYYRMQYVGANTEALSCAEQTFNI